MWAERTRVRIVKEIPPGLPSIQVDRQLTTRVLVNILANAVKFSPSDGTITVEAIPGNTGELILGVHDEGPGIPPEWAEKVFNKYAQIDQRKHGARAGAGLGLTFCKLAVNTQGGHIWVESDGETGTSVRFTVLEADGAHGAGRVPSAAEQTPCRAPAADQQAVSSP